MNNNTENSNQSEKLNEQDQKQMPQSYASVVCRDIDNVQERMQQPDLIDTNTEKISNRTKARDGKRDRQIEQIFETDAEKFDLILEQKTISDPATISCGKPLDKSYASVMTSEPVVIESSPKDKQIDSKQNSNKNTKSSKPSAKLLNSNDFNQKSKTVESNQQVKHEYPHSSVQEISKNTPKLIDSEIENNLVTELIQEPKLQSYASVVSKNSYVELKKHPKKFEIPLQTSFETLDDSKCGSELSATGMIDIQTVDDFENASNSAVAQSILSWADLVAEHDGEYVEQNTDEKLKNSENESLRAINRKILLKNAIDTNTSELRPDSSQTSEEKSVIEDSDVIPAIVEFNLATSEPIEIVKEFSDDGKKNTVEDDKILLPDLNAIKTEYSYDKTRESDGYILNESSDFKQEIFNLKSARDPILTELTLLKSTNTTPKPMDIACHSSSSTPVFGQTSKHDPAIRCDDVDLDNKKEKVIEFVFNQSLVFLSY